MKKIFVAFGLFEANKSSFHNTLEYYQIPTLKK